MPDWSGPEYRKAMKVLLREQVDRAAFERGRPPPGETKAFAMGLLTGVVLTIGFTAMLLQGTEFCSRQEKEAAAGVMGDQW